MTILDSLTRLTRGTLPLAGGVAVLTGCAMTRPGYSPTFGDGTVTLTYPAAGSGMAGPKVGTTLQSRRPLTGENLADGQSPREWNRGSVPTWSFSQGTEPHSTREQPAFRPPTATHSTTPPPPPVVSNAESEALNDYWIVSTQRVLTADSVLLAPGQLTAGQPTPGQPIGSNVQYFRRSPGTELAPCTELEFFAAARPGVPTCFIVHGMQTGLVSFGNIAGPLTRWLRRAAPDKPAQIVFYAWPGNGLLPIPNAPEFAIMGQRSSYQGVLLSRLINRLPPDVPVSLLGHSLGARVVASTLHLHGGGSIENGFRLDPTTNTPRRFRAAFLAGAIDHDWLNPTGRYGHALSVTERLLNLRNSRDSALFFYPLRIGPGFPAIGQTGLLQSDHANLGAEAAKVQDFDAAPFVDVGHDWANYMAHRELADAIAPYVFFLD